MRGRQMRAATRRGAEREERAGQGHTPPADSDQPLSAEPSHRQED
jgi:hypothetical protein